MLLLFLEDDVEGAHLLLACRRVLRSGLACISRLAPHTVALQHGRVDFLSRGGYHLCITRYLVKTLCCQLTFRV